VRDKLAVRTRFDTIVGESIGRLTYEREITALLVIDPHDDFIFEGRKVWDRLKGVAEADRCVFHMAQVVDVARKTATSRKTFG